METLYKASNIYVDVFVFCVLQGHQLLAMCYEKLDKPKQAISSYLKAIQLDNKHQDRQTDRLAQVVSRLCKTTNLVINLGERDATCFNLT